MRNGTAISMRCVREEILAEILFEISHDKMPQSLYARLKINVKICFLKVCMLLTINKTKNIFVAFVSANKFIIYKVKQ